jgi:hypothetical protein
MLHIHVCILSIYLIFWQNSWVFLGIRVHHGGSANGDEHEMRLLMYRPPNPKALLVWPVVCLIFALLLGPSFFPPPQEPNRATARFLTCHCFSIPLEQTARVARPIVPTIKYK